MIQVSAPFASLGCSDPGHCVTCGDDGVPMQVQSVDCEQALACCEDAGGQLAEVEIALVAPVAAGDELLVHAGVALTRLTPAPEEAGA